MIESTIPFKKLKNKHLISSLTLVILCTLLLSPLASAEAPYPTYGTAEVDGDIDEWDLTNDFFANMYRAGKEYLGPNPSPIESKLYVRYDISTATVYVLVLNQPDVIAILSADNAWVAIDGISNKVVKGNFGNDGVPPDFEWVYNSDEDLVGYEASFVLTPGTYNIDVHINVQDGGSQTSGTLSMLQLIVVPEAGTLFALLSIAGASGLFVAIKRKNNHK